MTCHVCSRPPNQRLQFHCPTCARNQLYPLRVDHVQTLLEKEAVEREIEKAVAKQVTAVEPDQPQANPTRWAIQAAQTRSSQSAARARSIHEHIAILKKEIEQGKEEISRRRAAIAQRRSDAESVNYRLSERRAASVSEVQSDIQKIQQKWNSLHSKTVESRVFLCREAANLYGLRQKARRRKGEVLSTYIIGGISIVDLRDLNNANPTHITTSLSHVAHLLVLVSHYLSLRLPAEIILPHREYPLPTIFPPAASYLSREHAFPGSTPHSSSTSPTASRDADVKPQARPRPLFINHTVPTLAREDPSTYTLFIEGVSLLAWDVAWVCRTQGVNIGTDSWEDVCSIGRNLWQLLVAPPALNRALTARDQYGRAQGVRDAFKNAGNHRASSLPKFGHYSHGSAHSFLGSAEGTEYMRAWKMPSPLKIADKLKSLLLSEMASAEWELVEEDDWDDGGEQQATQEHDEETGPIMVDTKCAGSNGDAKSTVTAKTLREPEEVDNSENAPSAQSNRAKGTSGWTKIRGR
ncbi:hypothetical protein VTO42DRAFT_6611 [Malbranchea cinnamomea]